MSSITSEEMAKWWPLFERIGRRFDGVRGAEFDDLVQEQALYAWQSLEKGIRPAVEPLSLICLAWIRFISHRGLVYKAHPYVRWVIHEEEYDATDYEGL